MPRHLRQGQVGLPVAVLGAGGPVAPAFEERKPFGMAVEKRGGENLREGMMVRQPVMQAVVPRPFLPAGTQAEEGPRKESRLHDAVERRRLPRFQDRHLFAKFTRPEPAHTQNMLRKPAGGQHRARRRRPVQHQAGARQCQHAKPVGIELRRKRGADTGQRRFRHKKPGPASSAADGVRS